MAERLLGGLVGGLFTALDEQTATVSGTDAAELIPRTLPDHRPRY